MQGKYRELRELSENVVPHTSVIQVSAQDLDVGNNGEVHYYFRNELVASIFNIDTHSGWITTQKNLDYER